MFTIFCTFFGFVLGCILTDMYHIQKENDNIIADCNKSLDRMIKSIPSEQKDKEK